MKLSRLLATTLLCVAMLVPFLLTGCATVGGTPASSTSSAPASSSTAAAPAAGGVALNVQNSIKGVCAVFPTALSQLSAIAGTLAPTNSNYAKAQADIAKAQPIVAAACTANATVDASTLTSLSQTALPALADLVGTLPLSAKDEQNIQAGLLAAQVVLGVANVVESQIAAAKSASATQ
jgi:hypothetical protein